MPAQSPEASHEIGENATVASAVRRCPTSPCRFWLAGASASERAGRGPRCQRHVGPRHPSTARALAHSSRISTWHALALPRC